LKQLTCTQNNISNLSPLKKLTGLEGLDVSDNLNTADNICDVICSMVDLKNIIVKSSNLKDRYLRQKLIRSCPSLECINGKVVSEVEKVFTQRLGKLRKVEKPKTVPIAIDEDAKPIPHLPPYATQYR
jgi:Leucine-rich repeat (LRR) protein